MSDNRLVAPSIAAFVVAAVLVGLPTVAPFAALGLWVATLVSLVVRRPHIAIVLAAAALAGSVVVAVAPSRHPEILDDLGDRTAPVTIELTSSAVEGSRSPYRGIVRAVGEAAVNVPVVVFDGVPTGGAPIGSLISTRATFTPADAGDSAAYLVFGQSPATITAPPPALLEAANAMRSRFRDVAATLPGDGARLLPGLAIGDTSAVTSELDSAMKASALSHLTAVSGANCAIVIGLIVFVGARLGLGRISRTLLAIVFLLAFITLVTPEPSVVRAGVMAIIGLATMLAGRPVRGVPVLCLAVLVLVISDPWMSRNFGFVLSVLATGGLMVLSGPLTSAASKWLPEPLAAIFAIPLAAQLACQPVLILLEPSIPVFGLVANVLAAPAAPIATIAGLIACLACSVLPPIAPALAMVAWLPAAWIAAVASFFTEHSVAIPWMDGAAGAAALASITVTGAFALSRARSNARRGATARQLSALLAVTLIAAVAASAAGRMVAEGFSRPSDWSIAMCDVGQGDAAIIRDGQFTAMIDTGADPERTERCLQQTGVSRLNLAVLTHFDLDHVGGVTAIYGRVDRVLVGPSSSSDDDTIVENFRRGGAIVDRVSQGDSGELGDLHWSVLWPRTSSDFEPGNDASIAMTFSHGDSCEECLSSLFLGDLSGEAQRALIAANRGAISEVDVIKVAHHGSADQDPEVYELAQARLALIGVGDNNYGHPNPALLGILDAVGTTVSRTDADGLILVSGGAELRVWRERSGVGGGD